MRAFLILEDGHVFTGESIGSSREIISEIVFNTSMTGYLEVLTDPSYAGQAVTMTYPLIGNYGICFEDMESKKAWPDGFIVRELSRLASNFRNEADIDSFLKEQDIPGIKGVDTRALTKVLREKGTMNGMITTKEYADLTEVTDKIKSYKVTGVVAKTTCKEKISYKPGEFGTDADVDCGLHVALLDVGSKNNIIRCLLKRGCTVTVYPAFSKAEEILAEKPDGIMVSNGPGDPSECVEVIAEMKKLYESGTPIFAICLGHQLMALATGAKTEKMKYGHRGANHPVKDVRTNRVYISSQNHGYVVKEDSLNPEIAKTAFVNVNDGTVEGLEYTKQPVFTVQFHPEACSGPKDSEFLFDEFVKMMEVSE
ncbi:MAG: carbamoyl phosphate synthase small subunit [Lachnospiraceae bacterium]|nr:carbamoyl phosphate synthase small subunit [Lachnospiraceae bacterium]